MVLSNVAKDEIQEYWEENYTSETGRAKNFNVAMAKEYLRNPVISSKSTRATLVDDIRITGEIQSWNAGEVKLKSPVFGEATFNANAIKTIEFNLGKPRTTASTSIRLNSTPKAAQPQINILRQRLQLQGVLKPVPPAPRRP